MDPDSFAMSSYQFVNSLASCYPQSQLAQQQQHQHPAGNQAAGNDYFANSSYNNPNLYSAQSHYANQNYLAAQQQQQATTADMVDYTQLQPQRMLGLQQSQPPPQSQPGHPSSATATANSCKYATGSDPGVVAAGLAATVAATTANTTAAGPIASPQDLSTGRDIISPKLSPNSVVENVARSLSKVAAVPTTNQQMLNNNNNNTNNSNHTTNVSLHSPTGDSETSSDSGAEDGGGRGSGGGNQTSSSKKGSGPPQIYPWMKRVHLGQSKCDLCENMILIYPVNGVTPRWTP